MPLRVVAVLLLALLPSCAAAEQPASTKRDGSKIWVGQHQDIEEYLRTAECVSMQEFAEVYVSRCTFRPGGPVARMAWRPLRPGLHRGFTDRPWTEIVAYELDKLLKMHMVPPAVERQLQGNMGAAQLWVEDVVDATDPTSPDVEERAHWERQVVRMTLFDNLIGNRKRNRGNMLRDGVWNLILIDHSGAFGPERELFHKLNRIDEDLWARIEALTRNQLAAALQAWLGESEIKAILDRREAMRAEIKLLRK
jgi:hypothetical protein